MRLPIALAGVEVNFLDVGFSEDRDNGRSLSFQRGLEDVDEDDAAMGLDSYCVTTDAGRTVYGGVEEAELGDGVLRLRLAADKAASLRVDPNIELELALEDRLRAEVIDNLRSVLRYGRSRSAPRMAGF